MNVLTYPFLGDAVKIGQALGCDPTGWPYRVESIDEVYEIDKARTVTLVGVEPWPIPGPQADEDEKLAYLAAMTHARDRMAGTVRVSPA